MKPSAAIDEWLRRSFPEEHVTGDSTNETKGKRHVTDKPTNQILVQERNHLAISHRDDEELVTNRENSPKSKTHKTRVDKLVHNISKLNNLFGGEFNSKYEQSYISTVASYDTGNWSQSPMGEMFFVSKRKRGSPTTISSGYESDFLPTCEDEIDSLLHSEKVFAMNLNNESKDAGYHETSQGMVPTNFRAWPGRHDLVCQQRLDRHNYKLTKVKHSMRGIIKDLKETDSCEVNKTRRSRSFDVSSRKITSDDSREKRRKSFSESRRGKPQAQADGYFVMECYHGEHWAGSGPGFESTANLDCVTMDGTGRREGKSRVSGDKIARETTRGHRERRSKSHKHKQMHVNEQCIEEKQWRYLANDSLTIQCDSHDPIQNSRGHFFIGSPVLTSTPRPGRSNVDHYDGEHIYETIPGDDVSVPADLAARIAEVPPELPARNYKKHEIDKRKSPTDDAFIATPRDLNNNSVPKFWNRLDGVSRDPRDRNKTKQTTPMLVSDACPSGRPRKSPLSGRTQREVRKVKSVPLVTSTKPDKNRVREQLDISTLKKKTQTFHDYTVADVLDSISRFESDEPVSRPDLIQNIPPRDCVRTLRRNVCDGYKMEGLFYGVSDRCGQKVAPQATWTNKLSVGNEIII
ncbi:uncharacterized protein LOC135490932 [Lineus longissimus]|uniref:uncharacterized protein LOC135490932 n=1 Tax=Lineus longissimus TaxID=88925 RepID=UPI00315D04B3